MNSFKNHSEFTDALFDVLYFGNGIDDLLSVAEAALGAPVFLHDVSFNNIGMSPTAKRLTSRLEKDDNLYFLNSSEIRRMQKYNVLEEINKQISAYIAKDSDEENTYWLLCSVRIHQAFSGYLVSVYDSRPENELCDIMTEISRAVSIELQKSNIFTSNSGLKYQLFMTNLIEGQFKNEQTVFSRLQILNKKLTGNYYLTCISSPNDIEGIEINDSVSEKLRQTFPVSMSMYYQDMLVILFSSDTRFEPGSELYGAFHKNLCLYKLKAAVSQCYCNILDTPIHFSQARNALRFAKECNFKEMICFTTDYLDFYLFSKLNTDDCIDLQYQVFNEMKEFDINHRSEFIPTLRAFFANNRSSSNAAAALHLHRTTFFYRIKRMEELWPISFSNERDLFLLELFMRLDDYKNL